MAQQSQSEDPMDALAHAAQMKLFDGGEESLSDWERGLILHHWTIQRMSVMLTTVDKTKFRAVKRQTPGLTIGAAVGAIVIFVKDLLNGG